MEESIQYPKILVAAPTFDGKDYLLKRWADRIRHLDYPNYDIFIVDTSKDEGYVDKLRTAGLESIHIEPKGTVQEIICEARNVIVKRLIEGNYDYWMQIEADVIPPQDIITELLNWKKDVISGWYYVNQGDRLKRPCIFNSMVPINNPITQKFDYHMESVKEQEMAKERLQKVWLGSFGVCLMKTNIFTEKGIKFRTMEKISNVHDDTWFYHDCEMKGIEVFLDSDKLVCHFQSDWAVRIDTAEKIEIPQPHIHVRSENQGGN